MRINAKQRKLITTLAGTFGGNPQIALKIVGLLNPRAISQIDTQAALKDSKDSKEYEALVIISKFVAPKAFTSRGTVGIIVEKEDSPQLAEVFSDDDKIGAIVVKILQGKLTKPEEVQSQVEDLFEDKHKAGAAKLFNFLLNKAK